MTPVSSSSSLPLMGIRNTPEQKALAGCVVTSLPLMGIRNAARVGGDRPGRHALTTPHGDQEPERRAAHPTRGQAAHYPSWGSGTGARAAGRCEGGRAHYPSWGSGTTPRIEDVPRQAAISLPLMGIRNPARPAWGAGVSPLTTPHGDQERCGRSCVRCSTCTHYPSWGSGTQRLRPGDAFLDVLTTPHGDQEHHRSASSPASAPTSLPLMGIRNPHQVGDPLPAQEPHYPSWGSGTGPATRCARKSTSLPLMGIRKRQHVPRTQPFQVSLPLMGIRNAQARPTSQADACESHYPSWGSGTRAATWLHRPEPLLTTPHGDQELGRSSYPHTPHGANQVPLRYRLTTPHGDQEPVSPTTPHGDATRRRVIVLTTPHGDQETRGELPVSGLTTPHGDQERSSP